jgi:hypothetical protein
MWEPLSIAKVKIYTNLETITKSLNDELKEDELFYQF